MRDYEKLVQELRRLADEQFFDFEKSPYIKAADAIEELQKRVELEYQSGFADGQRAANRKKNKWISVEERLPDFMHLVLAWVKNKDPKGRFNKDGVYVARLEDKIPQHDPEGKRNFWGIPGYDSEWTVYAWSYFTEPEVTHWMPLPEPPEEENNA